MKTKTGTVLVALASVAIVATVGVEKVVDTATGWLGGDTEIVGEGDFQIMVKSSEESRLKECTGQQIVQTNSCDDMPILLVDARRIPFIARNTKLAWESGLPAVLTMNRAKQHANRYQACRKQGRFTPTHPKSQCDEYPTAVTDEGGEQARVEEVPARENLCQGGMYGAQYPKEDGKKFLVVIIHPEHIASEAFAGVDLAKEKGLC